MRTPAIGRELQEHSVSLMVTRVHYEPNRPIERGQVKPESQVVGSESALDAESEI